MFSERNDVMLDAPSRSLSLNSINRLEGALALQAEDAILAGSACAASV